MAGGASGRVPVVGSGLAQPQERHGLRDGRGLRHRFAACETHGQEKRGEELNEHTRAVMS